MTTVYETPVFSFYLAEVRMKSNNNAKLQLSTADIRAEKVNRHDFVKIPRNEIYVILDRVDNGFNLGAILRLCDVALVKKLFIVRGKNSITTKALKAARGAEKWVPYEFVNCPLVQIQKLQEHDIKIVSVEIGLNSVDYRKFNFNHKPICFIFGNESDGVSESVLAISDICVHLPTYGMCNSLNVSSCAAIILYEAIK